jgi:hypothetical protein
VFAFHRPETLDLWLKEPATLRARRHAMPVVVTDGLRACQIDAVSALERSMAANRPRALVQMATGAGKTFTACTLSYRLLAHAGFKRILFLADRANLVRQTRDEFLAYRPPGTGRSLSPMNATARFMAPGGRCWNISMPSRSASPPLRRCTRSVSSARTSWRNTPTSARWWTVSMSASMCARRNP